MIPMPAAVAQLPQSFRPTTTVPYSMVGPALGGSAVVGDDPRSPSQGRVERRRGRRAGKKTRRGPKQTAYQRRYMATRPMGKHPRLRIWDVLPADIRSSLAGQERQIFRSSGLLVSRFDFQLHRTLADYSVGELARAFPAAPLWWPTDWGHLPITLPWEVSLYRSQLVSAGPGDAVWKETYQLFLEQLAAGWDLLYNHGGVGLRMETLPASLARAIVDAGGFSFCDGAVPSPSYRKFIELHSMSGEKMPDQRTAKAQAWQRIESLRSGSDGPSERNQTQQCRCGEQISRAIRRLGIDAQVLDAVRGDNIEEMGANATKLAALAGAALTYAISADGVLGRLDRILSVPPEQSPRAFAQAAEVVRQFGCLSESLPDRYRVNMARLE